ncbi:SH3 domain-binding protein 5-like protein [Aphelenchoides besseyi]|nr:SH3 domain-binding protein 5-like protein [Aphelenchoides besseyi]
MNGAHAVVHQPSQIDPTALLHREEPKTRERKSSSENGIHYVDDEEGVEFQLDARHLNRVHEELEKLNIATDVINKLELQLDHAREKFRQIHSEWSKRSEEIKKKYDTSIKKSRPYYEAMTEEKKLREEAQIAAQRFERANSMLQVAKQQVKLTQDSLTRQKVIEPECLEVLNHHVQRVNEAEKERYDAEEGNQCVLLSFHCFLAHRLLSLRLIECTQKVTQTAKDNSRAIKKTRHYFDLQLENRKRLDAQKQMISRLEAEVKQKKRDYTSSLRNLEQISDSIHEERSLTSTKNSARSPDSTRKSVSAIGLSDLDDELKRTAETQSMASSSSGGISISMRDSMIADAFLFDDDFNSHCRSNSELSTDQPNGVILLAQRLETDGAKRSEDDFFYHTKPEGILPTAVNPAASAPILTS